MAYDRMVGVMALQSINFLQVTELKAHKSKTLLFTGVNIWAYYER